MKLKQYDLPHHIRRWIATFLLDRTQQVKIGNNFSPTGHPKGGVPQGTLLGPKCFLVYINDLETPSPLYKYVDDSRVTWGKAPPFGDDLSLTYLFASTSEKSYIYVTNYMLCV